MGLFYQGKIYATRYLNWKHDATPLIFVLYSDVNKTHALNLHYFPQPLLVQFILFVKKFNKKFPIPPTPNFGRVLYRIIKKYYPNWAKVAYRTYKTSLLSGYLINDGITQPVKVYIPKYTPKNLYNRDLMAKAINENLKSSAIMEKIPGKPTTRYFGQVIAYREEGE